MCTYKPKTILHPAKTTCDGKTLGEDCTDADKHCEKRFKCENNKCGPIKQLYKCDDYMDHCESGTTCTKGYAQEWYCSPY
jgi:hypothetical protein